MAERAIFLDRDNTIIENDGYLGDATKVKLLTGAATAIAALRRLGYRIIVVSNQSGVARGMFSESDVEAVNQEMCRQLREQAGAHIDASYYCPYHPEAKIAEYRVDHDWRKPRAGMLRQAAEDFGLDLAQCWMVGDQPRDIAAGASAGCRTILLRDPDHLSPDADPGPGTGVSPNFIVRTLADAARVVSREGRNANRDLVPVPLAMPEEKPAVSETAKVQAETTAVTVPVGSPTPPGPSAGASTAAPARIDEAALAARIAEAFTRAIPTAGASRTERLLEDLLTHLRHTQRSQEYQPEFSLATFGAVILQVAAIVLMGFGVFSAINSATAAPNMQGILLLKAVVWTLAAVVLQGVVITLLLIGRRK